MNEVQGWWGTNDPIIFIVFLLLVVALNFLPSIIAFARDHSRRKTILLLNLFLGWTLIGWVVLMVWSLKGNRERLLPV